MDTTHVPRALVSARRITAVSADYDSWSDYPERYESRVPEGQPPPPPDVGEALRHHGVDGWMTGVCVNTTTGPIVAAIDRFKSCCEEFGVDAELPPGKTRDDLVGAVVLGVRFGREKRDEWRSTSELVVDTSLGPLVLRAYNDHNGYYPHDVVLAFDDTVEFFRL